MNGFREKVDALRKMFGQMGAVAGDQVVPVSQQNVSKIQNILVCPYYIQHGLM